MLKAPIGTNTFGSMFIAVSTGESGKNARDDTFHGFGGSAEFALVQTLRLLCPGFMMVQTISRRGEKPQSLQLQTLRYPARFCDSEDLERQSSAIRFSTPALYVLLTRNSGKESVYPSAPPPCTRV